MKYLIILGIGILLGIWFVLVEQDEHEFKGQEDPSPRPFAYSHKTDSVRGFSGSLICHVQDSYKITSKESIESICRSIKYYSQPNEAVYDLDVDDMVNEWQVHNLLYNLHIKRTSTESVDFKRNKWYTKTVYKILSWFY